jgi:hypothetical protein
MSQDLIAGIIVAVAVYFLGRKFFFKKEEKACDKCK